MYCSSVWVVAVCYLIVPLCSASNVLSSLADVDFHRIVEHSLSEHSGAPMFPPVTLTRRLDGAGYHRELVTNVQVERLHTNNRVLLVENITRDMYIDLDQISMMSEFSGPQILSSAYMDTEKPAAVSSHHIVLIYLQLIQNKVDLKLPIHFRYQSPSPDSSYAPVIIHPPMVFVPHPLGSASLPCHPHARDTCPWALLTTKKEREMEVLIPCGYHNSLSYVVIAITIFTTLTSTVVIFYYMHTMES